MLTQGVDNESYTRTVQLNDILVYEVPRRCKYRWLGHVRAMYEGLYQCVTSNILLQHVEESCQNAVNGNVSGIVAIVVRTNVIFCSPFPHSTLPEGLLRSGASG